MVVVVGLVEAVVAVGLVVAGKVDHVSGRSRFRRHVRRCRL